MGFQNQYIPLEPYPTFLGVKLDPKLSYNQHLEIVKSKQTSAVNLIKRIRKFKWGTSIKINKTIYKSLIRSLFDYCFIILQSGTQKILTKLQKIQNKILKIIKKFPFKTSIATIHKVLKLDMVEKRANELFLRFIHAKKKQDIIAQEIGEYLKSPRSTTTNRFLTIFDKID
ncbi:RNA-directed DNA polymerase from mobile element jockey-like [Brachionus plicatilis]|uniref:RNA-directed DNA polymerase from mobile element jockey-like n=1 Tax=Brachionus plicatilis TaxID=10195 RepID=A0A3M7SPG9_BRAPC|nr:RNA-directed DNA polymerase from mobile element jockey-like [Brachionus plicatilis]